MNPIKISNRVLKHLGGEIPEPTATLKTLGKGEMDVVHLTIDLEDEFDINTTLELRADMTFAELIGHVGDVLEAELQASYQGMLDQVLANRAPENIPAGLILRLVDEVHHWRADAACRLKNAMSLHDSAVSEQLRADIRVRDINPTAAALRDALSGDLHRGCEACGKAIIPGQATIHYGDIGEAHADCYGNRYKPGDTIPLDPDQISDEAREAHEERGEPLPTSITVGAAEDLFSEARIAEILHESDEWEKCVYAS